MSRELRTERRYFVVTPLTAELGGLRADIVDISTRGARLQLKERMESGDAQRFRIQTASGIIDTTAHPVWCDVAAFAMHDEETDRYFWGVRFEQLVPAIGGLIDDLLSAGQAIAIEDGRSCDRYRVLARVTASFADAKDLRVLDLSVRGVRIMTPDLLTQGASGQLRLMINDVEAPIWFPATVMWSRPANRKGRFEAGLRISGAEDWLRNTIEELLVANGAVIETDSLRRKFDPFVVQPVDGLMRVHR